MSEKRGSLTPLWIIAALIAVVGGAGYVVNEVPAAEHREQQLATISAGGDYARPVSITDGTLIADRAAGLRGELRTVVRYTVADLQGTTSAHGGPDLIARVIHNSGAVMVCIPYSPSRQRLDPDGYSYTLRCDRTVDMDSLNEWTHAELIACRSITPFPELRSEQPCDAG